MAIHCVREGRPRRGNIWTTHVLLGDGDVSIILNNAESHQSLNATEVRSTRHKVFLHFLRSRLGRAPFTVGRNKMRTCDCCSFTNCVSVFSRKGEALPPGPCPAGPTCTIRWKVHNRCEDTSSTFRVMVRAPLEHSDYRLHHSIAETPTSRHESRINHHIMVLVRIAWLALNKQLSTVSSPLFAEEFDKTQALWWHDILVTSKKWRLQSGCNHPTAYVDRWLCWESCEFPTQSPHAALRTGNAHQDLEKSEDICRSHQKLQVWPRILSLPSSGTNKLPKNLRKSYCGLQWLCVTSARHADWLARLLAAALSQ